jgi:uncharacterized membrane-anchored protein
MRLGASLLVVVLAAAPLAAQGHDPDSATLARISAGLKYQQGKIVLGDRLATLEVPSSFRFLDGDQASTVLVQAWGNPPGDKPLGMLVPADLDPIEAGSWAVIVTYAEDGYVKDDDAKKIDYGKLLKEMQEGTKKENPERVKAGYPAVTVVGWAESPKYDYGAHKLYWAKELEFGGDTSHTLNYDIRILGRRGVLVLSAVAPMTALPTVSQGMQEVLSFVDFNDGHRYTDFIKGEDKVAEYGIAGLVVGAVAAKAGLFKVLFGALLAFKKLIVVIFAGAAGGLAKLFGKKKTVIYEAPNAGPPSA